MNLPKPQSLSSYLATLRQVRHYSPHTVSNYERDIRRFYAFCQQESIAECTVDVCRRYLAWLDDRGYARKSIARMIAACRSYWHYLVHESIVDENPWALVVVPKLEKPLPKVADSTVLSQVLDSFPLEALADYRNLAIVELLYGSGIRVSECVGLNLDDVALDRSEAYVRGKGGVDRIAILSDRSVDALRAYLSVCRSRWGTHGDPAFFLNQRGSRLTARSVQRILKAVSDSVGLTEPLTPHMLRHSFATELLNGGANLKEIQELLGHQSLSSTQIYTHLTTDSLIKGYRKAHPRA